MIIGIALTLKKQKQDTVSEDIEKWLKITFDNPIFW